MGYQQETNSDKKKNLSHFLFLKTSRIGQCQQRGRTTKHVWREVDVFFFQVQIERFYTLRWWIENADCLPLFEYRVLLVFAVGDGTARARCHARGKGMSMVQ